ncbi:MAG: hypothetical protein Q9201_006329 [Fulgogasparrea decipioides]
MPGYLEFVSVFGIHNHFREPRFSGFRDQCSFTKNTKLEVDSLGRSGRQFQLCWNLKAPGKWTEVGTLTPGSEKWSVRQGAFHHQFDVENGTTLWIITKPGLDIKDRIQDVTGKSGNEEDRRFTNPEQCMRSSFAIHLLIGHWATEKWRQYFQWLEDKIEDETFLLVYDARGPGHSKQLYSSCNLQRAQELEEQTNEATMALQGNADVLTSLGNFYKALSESDDFPLRKSCSSDIGAFLRQVDNFIYDSNMQIARGKLLAQTVAARKTIILQHLQSQATEKMESLTLSMQRDSTTVRIIGTMTFLYLPGTFVSVSESRPSVNATLINDFDRPSSAPTS